MAGGVADRTSPQAIVWGAAHCIVTPTAIVLPRERHSDRILVSLVWGLATSMKVVDMRELAKYGKYFRHDYAVLK